MNLRWLVVMLTTIIGTTTLGLTSGIEPLSYDVTTIYRLQEPLVFDLNETYTQDNTTKDLQTAGPIEMQARTNARGLPLRFHKGLENITEPNVNVDIPPCTPVLFGCNWALHNITNILRNGSERHPIDYVKLNGTDWTSGNDFTQPQFFNGILKLDYKITGKTNAFGFTILLMESSASITTGNVYLLQFSGQNHGTYVIYVCTEKEIATSVSLPGGQIRKCTQKAQGTLNYFVYEIGRNFTFEVKRENGQLSVIIDYTDAYNNRKTESFKMADSVPIEALSFVFGTQGFSGVVTGLTDEPVLSVDNMIGSMVSPPLPQNLEKVCVSFVIYTDKEVTVNLLIQHDKTTTPVAELTLGADLVNGSWYHKQLIANVPGRTTSETRVVVMVTKQSGANVLLQRVSGCNAAEPEDIYVISEDKMNLKEKHLGGDVAHTLDYVHLLDHVCSNGGLMVKPISGILNYTERCFCPAGFTGDNCEKACGENRYGDDCGGICSVSKRGCRGMVLCRPELGCSCAPGLKKAFCVTPCDEGEYGNDCLQTCGNCALEPCDIFTGVCHQGCQPGFYPPFCKEVYSYISNAPKAVVDGFHCVSITGNLVETSGHGDPRFYQVQYKKENEDTWEKELPQQLPDKTRESKLKPQLINLGTVCGLTPGTTYQLRVVLIDESGAIYQGIEVKTTKFLTPCIVPAEADYNYYNTGVDILSIVTSHTDGFLVEWKFPSGNVTWCKVTGYEVHIKMGWQWMTHKIEGSDIIRKQIIDLLPGKKYPVKVRASTTHGLAAFTQTIQAATHDQAPDHVTGLTAKPTSGHVVKVSWGPPINPAGTIRLYYVTYQCLHLLACPTTNCTTSAGKIEASSTSIMISGLLPYATYNISVVGLSGSLGPVSSIKTATLPTAPHVAPSPVDGAIIDRSNSSFKVMWEPPTTCQHLHGYLSGYRYELISPDQDLPLLVGTTSNTTAIFLNLKPHTTFVVRVFAVNSAGWSDNHVLEIPAKTRATSPEEVGDLQVYKRGRRMLGVRWSKPRLTYGSLQSFTISYRPKKAPSLPFSMTVQPVFCPAWLHLYCHTIQNLKQDTEYTIGIKARNSEVNEDGDEVTVSAITKEGAPEAPSYIQVVNKTATSLTIEWGLPDKINGQLRSFLINFEETDSFNSSECCQYFPIREVIVTAEQGSYHYESAELRPASSYEFSVSAKTIALGPAVLLVSHTRPPTPNLTVGPKLMKPATLGNPLTVQVVKTIDFDDRLISGYLLLIEGGARDDMSTIRDEWLSNEISKALNHSFSLVAEITQADFPTNNEIVIQPGEALREGLHGTVGMPPLAPATKYQLVWALVLEYSDTFSVGVIAGESFTAK